MRRRVEELVPVGVRARELKLGTGGLRDVEFAVQLLQFVHGRTRRIASRGVDRRRTGRARRRRLRRPRRRREPDGVLRVPAVARTPPAAAAAQAHPHAARTRRRRGDALAGARRPHAARRPARRARRAARGAQAAEPARLAAARQALLPAAARIGGRPRRRPCGRDDARGGRTSARRTGLRGPAERADPPRRADQSRRSARSGAAGAAADPAGLALRHTRSRRGAAGLPADIARSWPISAGSSRRCATRVRWPSG